MRSSWRSFALRYGCAVVCMALAICGRLLLDPLLGNQFPFAIPLLAILVTARFGGFGPAVAAVVVGGIAADYFLILPRGNLVPGGLDGWVGLLLYACTGFGIALLGGSMHADRVRAEASLEMIRRMGLPDDAALWRQTAGTQKKVQAGFVLALLCLTVTGVIAFQSELESSRRADWTRHTAEVIGQLRQVLITTTDAETAQRGFVITGDEHFLEPYQNIHERVGAAIQSLRELTADNRAQQEQLNVLEPIVEARLARTNQNIALRRSGGFAEAQAAVASGKGKALQDEIRAMLGRMESAEQTLLEQRQAAAGQGAVHAQVFIAVSCIVAFGVVLVAMFLVQQDFARARVAGAELSAANAHLDARVRERTEELALSTSSAEQSEARLAGIVEAAMDAIISVNNEQKIVLFNTAAEKLFGCTAAEAIGQPPDRFIPECFREHHRQNVADSGQTRVASRRVRSLGTLNGLGADGRVFPIEAAISQVEVAGETIFTVILRDITERQRADEGAALLAAIVQSSEDAIIGKNLDGIVTSWNAGAEKIFGYLAGEMVGEPIMRLIPLERQHEEVEILTKVRRGESIRHFDTVRRRKDGGTLEVSVTVSPIKDATGRITGVSKVARDISERSLAAKILRETKERMRLATEATAVGIWEWNLKTNEVRWDAQMFRIYGMEATPGGLIPYDLWRNAVLPEDILLQEESLEETIRQRGSSSREFRIRRSSDGECRSIQAVERVSLNSEGQPEWVVGTNLDSTERRRMEEASRESEEKFRTMANSMSQLAWIARADGFIHWYNERWYEYTGTKPEQMEGWGWQSVHDPAVLPKVMEKWTGAIAAGEPFEMEFPLRRADGQFRDFLTRGQPLKEAAGKVMQWFGTNTDITVQKEAEHNLRAQLTRLALFDQITRAIGERQDFQSILQVVIRNLEDNLPVDFCCVCLHDEAAKTFEVVQVGVKSAALAMELAMPAHAVIEMDGNGLAQCALGQLVYEPDVREMKYPFPQRLAKGGLDALVIAPLPVEGKVIGFLVVARHEAGSFANSECEFLKQLSEHVSLAAHQAKLHTALQTAYDDLSRSQQAAVQQERLRAFGQMASGIAHDINNAISPVMLYTELLLDDEPNLSSSARGYLETIRRSTHDVAETIARMREFYRQREPQLTLAPIELNVLAQQVLDSTRWRWSDGPLERGVVIQPQIQLEDELPDIMGVESEIRDALVNLIFNAVDAMPEGGTLTLRTGSEPSPPGPGETVVVRRVFLEVTDSGKGMDEDTRRRCLEPFFTTKGERGTGLGLAMVYGMIKRHSAGIEIESTPGQGTTVRLMFTEAAVVADAVSAPPTPRVLAAHLRMLIIDDDPLLIQSIRDALSRDGHTVVTATGGQEGIHAFMYAEERHEPFAVVITDLGMPYVDGRKVARAVKAASPTTPVIMLTGWGQRLEAENDAPKDVDQLLSKPPKLRDLREALAACFPGSNVQSPPTQT